MKSVSLWHNLIPDVSRADAIFIYLMNAKIAGRPRQTMTTACSGSSVRVPSLFISATGYRNANRIVPSRVARGGITTRARRNGGALLEHGNYCFIEMVRGKEQGRNDQEREREGRKGKGRKLINSNHRAPIPRRAKDRSARLRLTASATISHSLYRAKSPGRSRTCVRTEWRQCGISHAGDFPRFPSAECIRFHPWKSPFVKTNVRDKKYLLGASPATRKKRKELEAKDRKRKDNGELREGRSSRER